MPKNNNVSKLKNSLARLLTNLQRIKINARIMYNIDSINEGINALESIQSIPIDSLQYDDVQCDDVQFIKQLINIEQLFIHSSLLQMYSFPKFREIINPPALVYAEIDLQLDALENKAKNLLDRGNTLESSEISNTVFSLRKLNRVYFIKGKIDYTTYKERSLALIKKEQPELEKDLNYPQISENLLILIDALGKEPFLNKVQTELFLFFKQPDDKGPKQIETPNEAISSVSFEKKRMGDPMQNYRQDSKIQHTTL